MPARTRSYSTEYQRRAARVRAMGWTSPSQRQRWQKRLTDAYVRELAEQIGGPVEPERAGSLMSLGANAIVNPRGGNRDPRDWQVRLLVAAGKIKEAS